MGLGISAHQAAGHGGHQRGAYHHNKADCFPPASTAFSPKATSSVVSYKNLPNTTFDSATAPAASVSSIKGASAQKRKREADLSTDITSLSADEQTTGKRGTLKANGRTAGGSRLIRPVTSAKSSPKMSITSSHSSSPEPRESAQPSYTNKATAQVTKSKGANRWYTSSEGENGADQDAEGVSDTEMEDVSRESEVQAPKDASSALAEYRGIRSEFATLHSSYAKSRQELVEQRRLFETLIEGGTLSAAERLNVRSKNEIGVMVQRVQKARQTLLDLQKRICDYAKSQ